MEEVYDNGMLYNALVYDLNLTNNRSIFNVTIASELAKSKLDLEGIEDQLTESIETLTKLTPKCDKLDYILAASSGALCGIIDVFLVGKPGESPLGDITDKWFENRVKGFAKLFGWNGDKSGSLSSAISHIEKKFNVNIPYDQRGAGDAGRVIFGLTPGNHHFKSLAHNPTLLGLFFSILDQFSNTSHFVSDGQLISLQKAKDGYELQGHNILSKLFCGFANWILHLITDVAGSGTSKGRGMGIPSPFWSWTNDIIAIKAKLKIPVSEFDKSINNLALQLFNQGYDSRFQTTQTIPVFINELLVRLIYSIRRLINYYVNTEKSDRTWNLLWLSCEPFSNASVKRMLTVAHGTFCLVDAGDAVIRGFSNGGGSFNVVEFFMRLNIVGIGRFTISLYGEGKRGIQRIYQKEKVYYLQREKSVLVYYMDGLKCLSEIYDDKDLLTFVDDLKCSELYRQAFDKTIKLAEKRSVPENKILRNKLDIDSYFKGGRK